MFHEQRQFERRPYEAPINLSVNVLELKELKILNLMADNINISEGGICIRTNYPLENGHVVRFHTDIGRSAGLVRWCKAVPDNVYIAGVKFV